MTKLHSFFKHIGAEITLLFSKHLPKDWQLFTDNTINFLNTAKNIEHSQGVIFLASLLPKGIGNVTLAEIQKLTIEALSTLEIAKGCENAIIGITDPTKQADAIFAYIILHIQDLPPEWQGKHWLDIAVKILTGLLGITTTEANAIINIRYGTLKTS